jgi:predicted nucleic acid-binding protein
MIVVDASVLIDAALGNYALTALIASAELHAPSSIDAEVLHGLRRVFLRTGVAEEEVRYVIDYVSDVPIHRHWVKPFLHRMWSLRHNVTAYDAGYVALAESLGYPLITRDQRLAKSSGHAARIEYID